MADSASRVIRLFAPGRLCLFGEHSDWAAERGLHDGYCIVIGTDQGLTATARKAKRFVVDTPVPNGLGRPSGRTRQMSCPMDDVELLEAANDPDEFFRYCAGVAHCIRQCRNISGLHLHITAQDLPLRKGVSSSAATCILVAQAFDQVYKLGLLPHELMDLAYRGEKLTGSQCGRMDQACIYGKTPVLLTFSAKNFRVEPLFPRREIHMFFVDLGGQKDTVKILRELQVAYATSPALRDALGRQNERLARGALRALCDGDARGLGALMNESQRRFDADVAPHCLDQLASPLLHALLTCEGLLPHIHGGKGVGSHGDGTAQFVARSDPDRQLAMQQVAKHFPHMQCFPLTIPSCLAHQSDAAA
jgi:galactokinase